jgi:hypothetical protein
VVCTKSGTACRLAFVIPRPPFLVVKCEISVEGMGRYSVLSSNFERIVE